MRLSQYSDELGAWWTGFPGSDRAAWLASRAWGAGARPGTGVRGGHVAAAHCAHGLVVPAGKPRACDAGEDGGVAAPDGGRHPRAGAQIGRDNYWLGLSAGTGKTDVAVTLAAIYAAARAR